MIVLCMLYLFIELYVIGMFDVGDGYMVYYECVGMFGVKFVVFLYGGLGGGVLVDYCCVFDFVCYDVMLFDQCGCGWLMLYVGLEVNIMWYFVVDIECLCVIVGVECWFVFGGLWGLMLVFVYVQKYLQQVSEFVLCGIYIVMQVELCWYYQYGVLEMFFEKWACFQVFIFEVECGDMIVVYCKVFIGNDIVRQIEVVCVWSVWEGEIIMLLFDLSNSVKYVDDYFVLVFVWLENYYFMYQCWLEEGQLLCEVYKLVGIFGVIVYGCYDMLCFVCYVYVLYQVWFDLDFYLIEGVGYVWFEFGIFDQLLVVMDCFVGK